MNPTRRPLGNWHSGLKTQARRHVAPQQLPVADVAPDDGDLLRPVVRAISRSSAPWIAAVVAIPARRLWPETWRGSTGRPRAAASPKLVFKLRGRHRYGRANPTATFQSGVLHASRKRLNLRHRHRSILAFQNQVILEPGVWVGRSKKPTVWRLAASPQSGQI